MTLYLLDHRHWMDDEYYDTKLIGIYSTHSLVLDTIERYSRLPGFCDFKSDFHIESFKISMAKKKAQKHIVYLVTNTKIVDDDEITVSYRIFSNIFHAKLFCIKKNVIPYSKIKQKFYIDKCYINKDNWSDGFIMVK